MKDMFGVDEATPHSGAQLTLGVEVLGSAPGHFTNKINK